MNVVVIGLGSMGKRRIRLLKKCPDIQEIFGVDARADRRSDAENASGIPVYQSLEEALACHPVECAVISTSPLSHHAIIKKCLEYKLHVFSEINLVSDGYEDNMRLALENGRVLFLSSTFLYREEIKYIQREVKKQDQPVNYIYHVGQYLPDWHPWENYENFFVGDKRTGGCREIMAIEFPWILETFGSIKSVSAVSGRLSQLKVSYDDCYVIRIEHENGSTGTFIVDVVCPKAVRNLEVYRENFYLSWDGTPSGLQEYDQKEKGMRDILLYEKVERSEGYQSTIIENAYANELEEFLEVVRGEKKQSYGFKKDLNTLNWLDQIEGVS